MTMLGYRSLKFPAPPDRTQPDYHAQWAQYWQQSDTWWDNWSHNLTVAMIVLPALLAVAVACVLIAVTS